jgi:hypothetical protein
VRKRERLFGEDRMGMMKIVVFLLKNEVRNSLEPRKHENTA